MDEERAAKIAELNDKFRRNGFEILLTPEIRRIKDLGGLIQKVRRFNKFTEDNDPHHEHDFGQVAWYRQEVFWKIDYYDQSFQYFKDPLSPKCNRVLTIMLASEY